MQPIRPGRNRARDGRLGQASVSSELVSVSGAEAVSVTGVSATLTASSFGLRARRGRAAPVSPSCRAAALRVAGDFAVRMVRAAELAEDARDVLAALVVRLPAVRVLAVRVPVVRALAVRVPVVRVVALRVPAALVGLAVRVRDAASVVTRAVRVVAALRGDAVRLVAVLRVPVAAVRRVAPVAFRVAVGVRAVVLRVAGDAVLRVLAALRVVAALRVPVVALRVVAALRVAVAAVLRAVPRAVFAAVPVRFVLVVAVLARLVGVARVVVLRAPALAAGSFVVERADFTAGLRVPAFVVVARVGVRVPRRVGVRIAIACVAELRRPSP